MSHEFIHRVGGVSFTGRVNRAPRLFHYENILPRVHIQIYFIVHHINSLQRETASSWWYNQTATKRKEKKTSISVTRVPNLRTKRKKIYICMCAGALLLTPTSFRDSPAARTWNIADSPTPLAFAYSCGSARAHMSPIQVFAMKARAYTYI